jgi:hypothetical protein
MASVFPTKPEFEAGMREAGLVPHPKLDLWWEPPESRNTPGKDQESP